MSDTRIINDPVHGFIKLHPLVAKIIDTPQFQRLRDIKELGVCYLIFPGASHNRFEHSLGTSHLCGKMIDTLRDLHSSEEEGYIEITEVESLCIKIAGLCHDLGHGPFSNFFDRVYIPRVIMLRRQSANAGEPAGCSRNENAQELKWTHKQASCDLFDFMLREEVNPGLDNKFREYGLKEEEKNFIKDLILGERKYGREDKRGKIRYARSDVQDKQYKKSFLFEIVCNKRNGIDCGKFDYFARDCHNVGVKSNFDSRRYFHTIRVMPVGDELQIFVRDKEVFNLYELFHTRWSLHHRVYRHKTEAPIEDMLTEALLKVDRELQISDSIRPQNMGRYTNLTDSIVYDILRRDVESKQEEEMLNSIARCNDEEWKNAQREKLEEIRRRARNLKEAQNILLKIQRREFYKFCGEMQLPVKHKYPCPENVDQDGPHQCPSKEIIADEIASKSQEQIVGLRDRIFISIVYIHFGKKGEDPVDSVQFYNKSRQAQKIEKRHVSHLLPKKFDECYLRVYAKSRNETKEVQKCFKEWSKDKDSLIKLHDDQSGSIQEMQK